jgi:addiction module RelB/DinJ family antitoxin
MSKTILNIKIDPKTKQEIQELASEMGLPVSAIINAQIKQILRDRRMILSTNELEPTPYLEKIIKQVEKDRKTGKNISGPFETAAEMIAHLKA